MAQSDSDELNGELIVFAKAPRVGEVKTRLAASIGPEAACAAYGELLSGLAESLRRLRNVTVMFSPPDAQAELQRFFPAHWRFRPQIEGDLGTRLLHALPAIVIGSDCPYVLPDDIRAACEALRAHDVVFGPAKDGGYWLIGARRVHDEMFANVEWGTARVLEQNLRACEQCGIRTALLRTLEDVDTVEEWRRFEETLPREQVRLR